jgi:hypothetical protein
VLSAVTAVPKSLQQKISQHRDAVFERAACEVKQSPRRQRRTGGPGRRDCGYDKLSPTIAQSVSDRFSLVGIGVAAGGTFDTPPVARVMFYGITRNP